MSSTFARRRVATRLTRSTSSKSKDSQDANKSPSKSASPSNNFNSQDDDIPVPQATEAGPSSTNREDYTSASHGRTHSISSSASGQDAYFSHSFPTSSANGNNNTNSGFSQDPMSPSSQSFAAIYTPSRSAFSSSVTSSKRKASGDIDPSSLRRSVRQRAEASPFRLDSTEAQRDSTLFISQPQTPSKFKNMAVSLPTNRKDSLFMSLPASFNNNNGDSGSDAAQYPPIFDISLLSANSNASCFLPMNDQAQSSTTPAQEPPLTASFTDLGPGFDLLQYNDFISPFPPTPQPAFLNFPPTPTRLSGTFSIAPQSLHNTPATASFPIPLSASNLQKMQSSPGQYFAETAPKTPLNPIRSLPRRARRSSACSSNAGSIIVKDVEDDHDEDGEEGDATAQPGDDCNRNGGGDQQDEADDERFALFASQVRRKAEAMSLKSSQGAGANGMTSSPAPRAFYNSQYNASNGFLQSSWSSDIAPNEVYLSNGQAGFAQQSQEQPGGNARGPGAGASFRSKHDQVDVLNLPPMPEPLPPLPAQYQDQNSSYTDHQYSSIPLSGKKKMGVSPNKAVKAKRLHHNKNRGDKPPRPRNCFILYRSDKVEEVRRQTARDKMQKDISKIVADLWRNEPQSVKDEYTRRANVEREQHLLKYPGYVYQPTRKDKPADEEESPLKMSPLKRSGSARPDTTNGSDLSKSAPASRSSHSRFKSTEEEEEDVSEYDERAESPSPSKTSRSRTPLRQSRIPVPTSVNKGNTYSTPAKTPARQLSIPMSTQRPVQSARRANDIAKNATDFANQRGLGASSHESIQTIPASARMSQSRSTPLGFSASSVAKTPSAPRYAQPTSASMSKSMSQPLPALDQSMRSTPVHPQHQYAAYGHIHHPLPQDPLQPGLLKDGLFSETMTSTPVDQQRTVFPDLSLGYASTQRSGQTQARAQTKLSPARPQNQRSQTFQPANNGGSVPDTPSRIPSVRRNKRSPPQSNPAHADSTAAIPDGFVVGGKLYPHDNVEEAMKAYQALQQKQRRIASDHSNVSNGPVQEIMMPALPMYAQQQHVQQQLQIPMQYCAQSGQNYVIGVGPDGEQIPLLVSQPQSMQMYQPWQSVPAFMSSSTQATPSTGFAQNFPQSADPLQRFDFGTVHTPNTGNSITSNMSNMPLSSNYWYPQMSPSNQATETSPYLITDDPTLGGTSPAFYMNDANGHQQLYTLAGPSVSVEVGDNNAFAPSQEAQWTSA